jgi:hypothetical protein
LGQHRLLAEIRDLPLVLGLRAVAASAPAPALVLLPAVGVGVVAASPSSLAACAHGPLGSRAGELATLNRINVVGVFLLRLHRGGIAVQILPTDAGGGEVVVSDRRVVQVLVVARLSHCWRLKTLHLLIVRGAALLLARRWRSVRKVGHLRGLALVLLFRFVLELSAALSLYFCSIRIVTSLEELITG